jgi:predicted amidohydrolase
MTKFIFSVAQFHSKLGNIPANINRSLELIRRASQNQAVLILFPELWTSGYDLENAPKNAQKNLDEIEELVRCSHEFNISIAGSYLLKDNDKIFNRFLLIDPQLGLLPSYDKIHLFQLTGEEKIFTPGTHFTLVDEPWGKTALTICYDLRFPEFYRKYAVDGARVFLVPAQWPERRINHWKILLQARAVENQCFILGCNSVGTISGDVYGGNSAIIDPWGKILAEADGQNEELLYAEVDPGVAEKARSTIPVFSDRRPDLY